LINRIPASDISPTIWFGGEFVPVKTIPFEKFKVEATVIREGHDDIWCSSCSCRFKRQRSMPLNNE